PSAIQPSSATTRPGAEASSGSVSVLIVGCAYELVSMLGCMSSAVSSHRLAPTNNVPQVNAPILVNLAGVCRCLVGPPQPTTTTLAPRPTTPAVAGHESLANQPTVN